MAEVPNGSKLLENVVVVEKKSENGSKNGNQNGQNTAEVIPKMKDEEAAINITTQKSGKYKIINQRLQQSYTDIMSPVHRPPKSLPKKGGILLLKGDRREI